MTIQTEEMVARLVSQGGYGEREARRAATDLAHLPPRTAEAFHEWWISSRTPAFEVGGWSVRRLREEWQMTEVAAYLTLGWLEEDPEAALAAMAEGIDQVW